MNLRSALTSRVTRDIGKAFSGRVTASLLRLGMTVLLARVLLPSQYGMAAVLLNSGLLLSTVLEFGLGAAFIERESRAASAEHQRTRFLQLLLGRFWLWAVILLATLLAWTLGLLPGSIAAPVLLFGTGQNLCVTFLLLYQVRQDFGGYARASVLLAGVQVVWAGLAAAILFLFSLPFEFFLWALGTVGWAPLPALAWQAHLRLDTDLLGRVGVHFRYLRSLLPFGKWVGLSSIAVQAFSRYGVLLLGAADVLAEAGRYDVAMSVGRSVNLLTLSTAAALFPRFAQRPGLAEARRLLPSVLRAGGAVLALGLAFYYLIGRWLVPLIYGANYRTSVVYLDILMPGLLLPILVEPVVGIVTFSLGSPGVIFWIRAAKLAAFVAAGHWLLANFSVKGLAAGQTVLAVLENAAILGFAFWATRRVPETQKEGTS